MKQNILVFQIVLSHDFYIVVITRSRLSGVNMSITAEVREYSENLIKPLITNKSLKELLCKFKGIYLKIRGEFERAKSKESRT